MVRPLLDLDIYIGLMALLSGCAVCVALDRRLFRSIKPPTHTFAYESANSIKKPGVSVYDSPTMFPSDERIVGEPPSFAVPPLLIELTVDNLRTHLQGTTPFNTPAVEIPSELSFLAP